ncbi:MAG: peptidoglycan-binding protein [Devosia sp.]
MARATSSYQTQDYDQPATGEWQELRGELVALLDQVEGQVSRAAQEPGYQGLAERMRDLRNQVGENGADARHREALRSVQKAVQKFSDRDAPPPPNPRDTLEDAIQQIRARHFNAPEAAQPQPAPRFDDMAHAVDGISDRLERLEAELRTQAKGHTANVHEIAEQVGQLSHVVELLAGAVGETGQVKRLEGHIAGLAKLITDGPQVDVDALNKRLDDVALTVSTLAELQKQYGDRSDVSGMEARFDDVSATVGRLADLQVQFVDKISAPNDGLKVGIKAVEDGVRNIYDRVDAIERAMALPSAELETITAELGRIATMVKTPSQPQGLIELIDALNTRISDIEARSAEVGELKIDMEAFRATVLGVIEPRFAKLETQIDAIGDMAPRFATLDAKIDALGGIEPRFDTLDAKIEALGDKLGEQPTIEPSIAQLEAQVRQLVARMDQTGEQLTGLAKLYGTPAAAPDLTALADMVATRTSDAVKKQLPTGKVGFDEDDYAEIEKRVGKLIEAAATQAPQPETVALNATINEVSARLQRLETSLSKPTEVAAPAPLVAEIPVVAEPVKAEAKPVAPAKAKAPEPIQPDPIAPLIEALAFEDDAPPTAPVKVQGDSMPANPNADLPLIDTPYGDPDPVQAAFDALRTARTERAKTEPVEDTRPLFDPSLAERPPQPKSSLDLPDDEVFVAAHAETVVDVIDESAAPNRNAFIEAHRRASRQAAARATPAADSNSLIGRAFARFQAGQGEAAAPAAAPETPKAKAPKVKAERPAKPVKAAKLAVPKAKKAKPVAEDKPATEKKSLLGGLFGGSKRELAGDKDPPTGWTGEEPVVEQPELPIAPEPSIPELRTDDAEKPKGSFLVRHRQPILLAATVVAIACLTLNLINQRSKPADEAQPTAQAGQDVGDATLTPVPMAQQGLSLPALNSAATGAKLDGMTTASIDGIAQNFVADVASPMPPGLQAATTVADVNAQALLSDTVAPLLESPVKVDRPPAEVGPEPLLAAAADGDARAQFEVAAIYTEGRAVPEDLETAAMWYERAASQGFVPAQYRLGNLYENGRGVEKDLEQARLWYQQAAEGGNRMAMHNLAALYAGGGLGEQQFDAAAKWFEEAAGRGMKDSQFNLGMLYARGLGVKQDLSASFKWFSLAANRGDADAAKARDDVASSLDATTVQALIAEVTAFKPIPIDFVANFAPIGTWSSKFDPGSPIATPKVVMGVQKALSILGFDVGTPDGVAGARTAEAIKSFERATGMSESGEINPRLLAVLGSQPV